MQVYVTRPSSWLMAIVASPQASPAVAVTLPRASTLVSTSQLSFCSRSWLAGPSMERLGGVVSSMVNVADVWLVLPQSSLAVKVTVTAPVAPQRSLSVASLWLNVTALQLSLASAPPLSASHPARSAVLPAPSHSTVRSEASVSMLGAMMSVTVIVWVHVLVVTLLQWSVPVIVNVRAMV